MFGMSPAKSGGNGNGKPVKERRTPCCFCVEALLKDDGTQKVLGGVGGVIALRNIGILGHLINHEEPSPQPPVVHLPNGPYSSYKVKAGKDGYTIEYRADDPKVLESSRSLDLDKEKTGFFGRGGTKKNRVSS